MKTVSHRIDWKLSRYSRCLLCVFAALWPGVTIVRLDKGGKPEFRKATFAEVSQDRLSANERNSSIACDYDRCRSDSTIFHFEAQDESKRITETCKLAENSY